MNDEPAKTLSVLFVLALLLVMACGVVISELIGVIGQRNQTITKLHQQVSTVTMKENYFECRLNAAQPSIAPAESCEGILK